MDGRRNTLTNKSNGYDRKFYKSARWHSLRESIMRRDGYMCRECRRFGKCTEGTNVHHILPREQFPQYQYDPRNLITLCNRCHDAMHYRADRSLTDTGKTLARRMCRQYNIDIEL